MSTTPRIQTGHWSASTAIMGLLRRTTLTCQKAVLLSLSLSLSHLQPCLRDLLHHPLRRLNPMTSSLPHPIAQSTRVPLRLWLASFRRSLDRRPPRVPYLPRRPLLHPPKSVCSSHRKSPTTKRRLRVYRKGHHHSPSHLHPLNMHPRAPQTRLHADPLLRGTLHSINMIRAKKSDHPVPLYLALAIICITSTST
jgi:hypothetical protein